MKTEIILIFLPALFTACDKNTEKKQCDTFLSITSTNTVRNTTVANGITTIISCVGPNLCYSYTNTEIAVPIFVGPGLEPLLRELRAKGKMSCSPRQICAQAIYEARDTINIPVRSAGVYYLMFYNGSSLFKTDTVIVN